MTYREKLKMEHPEATEGFTIGGCKGCPSKYGYGPESCGNCGGFSDEKCTKCWDTVIPGTEEKKYENLSRDDLITLIKLLGGRIETKDKVIANYTAACTDKNTRIIDLKKECEERKRAMERAGERIKERDNAIAANNSVVKELEQKIQKLEGACSAKNAEIVRLDKELNEEKTRKYFWCEDNCFAMVKDKEIQRLSKLLGDRDDEIQELKRKNENQAEYIRRAKVMARSSFGTLCPCHCSGCKEIERLKKSLEFEISHKDYWYNRYHSLTKKVDELVNSNQELKDALAKEKSEHAKHHSLFSQYFAD